MPAEQIRLSALIKVFPKNITECVWSKTPTVPFRNYKRNQEQG